MPTLVMACRTIPNIEALSTLCWTLWDGGDLFQDHCGCRYVRGLLLPGDAAGFTSGHDCAWAISGVSWKGYLGLPQVTRPGDISEKPRIVLRGSRGSMALETWLVVKWFLRESNAYPSQPSYTYSRFLGSNRYRLYIGTQKQ